MAAPITVCHYRGQSPAARALDGRHPGPRGSSTRGLQTTDLESQCDLLRSLHRPGTPLLLPNAWDVATARAVVAAGFPVVATTSGGVAAALGY